MPTSTAPVPVAVSRPRRLLGPVIAVLLALAFSISVLFFAFRTPKRDHAGTTPEPTQAPISAPTPQPTPREQPLQTAAVTSQIFSEMPVGIVLDKAPVADKQQQGLISLAALAAGDHTLEIIVQGFRHTIRFSVDPTGVNLPDPGPPSHIDTVLFYRRNLQWSALSSIQDGEVTIDAKPVTGLPKVEAVPLADGPHNIAVRMTGKPPVAQDFQIAPSDRLLIWVRPLVPVFTVETNLEKFDVLVKGKLWAAVQGNRFSFRRYPADRFEVSVRKDDYLVSPENFVFDKKTTKVPLAHFELKPRPKFSFLVLQADRPNIQVSLDNNNIGATDANGHLEFRQVEPGEHKIDLSLSGHDPKTLRRRFVLGETLTLSRAETKLEIAMGTLSFELSPSTMRLTFTKDGETAPRPVTGAEIRVEPGSYTFNGTAPGFQPGRQRITIGPGGRQKVIVVLTAEAKSVPKPPPAVSIWADGVTWKDGGDGFQTPASRIPVLFLRQPDAAIINFHVKWAAKRKFLWYTHYQSERDNVLWELSNKELKVSATVNGKKKGFPDFKHNLKDLNDALIRIVLEPQRASATIEGRPSPSYSLPQPMSGRFGIVTTADPFFIKGFNRQ